MYEFARTAAALRATDLAAVVEHDNTTLSLNPSAARKADLVQYLQSL